VSPLRGICSWTFGGCACYKENAYITFKWYNDNAVVIIIYLMIINIENTMIPKDLPLFHNSEGISFHVVV
jgi:hypothetical protein